MKRIGALWGSTHPGPSLVVTALAVLLGSAARLPADRLVLLALAVLLGQLSVGLSNDAIDARRDRRVGRSDKPIARGDVSVTTVWVVAGSAAAGALIVSAFLGPGMLIAHLIALTSAWSYNTGLKATPISVVPFVVSFGLFPSLATLSGVSPTVAVPWAWVAGAALGVAVHFTNVLPDLDDDAVTGIRGLPHRLGRRASAVLAFAAVEVGAVAVLIGPPIAAGTAPSALVWVAFGAVLAVGVLGLVRALARPPDRLVFRLVMLAALLLAGQLALSGLTPGTA